METFDYIGVRDPEVRKFWKNNLKLSRPRFNFGTKQKSELQNFVLEGHPRDPFVHSIGPLDLLYTATGIVLDITIRLFWMWRAFHDQMNWRSFVTFSRFRSHSSFTCQPVTISTSLHLLTWIITAGSIKREKSTFEAENSKLKDKVRDLQQHLHAMRTSQAEQNKFHHETVQSKKETEVCATFRLIFGRLIE